LSDKWSGTKSLTFSRVLVYALLAFIVILIFCIPIVSKWFDVISVGSGVIKGSVYVPVCVMLYICDVFALIAANALRVLLENIRNDRVFVKDNTACLRRISWCCIFVGITFFLFSLWRFEFLFATFFACFLGLVMRVLKNVFEKAVEIKSENDFTV
jgi:hypothetical protein